MQPVYIIHEQCVNDWFPLFRDELVFCNLYHDKKKITEQFCCAKSVDRDEMINYNIYHFSRFFQRPDVRF